VLDFQVRVLEKTLLVRVHPSQKAKVDAPIKIQLKPAACIVLKISTH
jgi:hypothetical protein